MTNGAQPMIAVRVAKRTWTSGVQTYFLKSKWLRGYTLLSRTLLTMICLLALPILTLVTYSFWSQTYVYIDKSFTLKNYEVFFNKWISGELLLRSINMSATATAVTILLAYPVVGFLAFKVTKNQTTWPMQEENVL